MVEGRYIHPLEYYKTLGIVSDSQIHISPVFAAFCTPLICPENAESLLTGSTQIFHCQHEMDLRFLHVDVIALEYFGFTMDQLQAMSLYSLVHPDELGVLIEAHQIRKQLLFKKNLNACLVCEEKDGAVMCLIRIKSNSDKWLWLHSVLTIKPNARISGIYQCFSDSQAESLRKSPWIYSTKHYNSNYRGETQKEPDQLLIEPPHIYSDPNNNNNCSNMNPIKSPEFTSPGSSSSLSTGNPGMNIDSPISASKSICLEQLQQFYASELFSNALPELLGHDLEEYFRQVEQQPSDPSTNDRGIKREYIPEQPEMWNNNSLPPVSSIFQENNNNHPLKRHCNSVQPNELEDADWHYLHFQRTQKRLGSWAGISTG
jgi:hypothetical protein